MGTVYQLVDGAKILQPFKAMVYGKEAVVVPQFRENAFSDLVKGLLTLGITRYGGHRIEIIERVFRKLLKLDVIGR